MGATPEFRSRHPFSYVETGGNIPGVCIMILIVPDEYRLIGFNGIAVIAGLILYPEFEVGGIHPVTKVKGPYRRRGVQ